MPVLFVQLEWINSDIEDLLDEITNTEGGPVPPPVIPHTHKFTYTHTHLTITVSTMIFHAFISTESELFPLLSSFLSSPVSLLRRLVFFHLTLRERRPST